MLILICEVIDFHLYIEGLLLSSDLDHYRFIKNSNKDIEGVDDVTEFKQLLVCIVFTLIISRRHLV